MKTRNGWSIEFQKNIHMYCHRLIATGDGARHEIPCEDTPEGFVGVWLYDLALDEAVRRDLLAALVEWAEASAFPYRIYTARDAYVAGPGAAEDA